MSLRAAIEALLFDIGGVLIDIDFERALRHWAPMSAYSFDELKSAFAFDAAYQRHERGEIGASEYFEALRTKLRLEGSDAQIAAGWNAIFVGEIAGALSILQEARAGFPCYAFTNTNPTHHAAWTAAFPEVCSAFDRVFASSEIGLRKPERAAFEAVARAMGTSTSAILFLDDTLENVLGARQAGMQAEQVRSTAGLRAALARTGLPRRRRPSQ